MNYDTVKFERGQVWIVRFKNQEANGHEIMKDRPWLVLSDSRYNRASGMITMAPITTRDYIVAPSQVLFCNNRGIKNVILCEQIRAFDSNSGAYLFDYLGNLSDEVLEKVDVAISIHLGLHYSPITLKKLYDSMESIIRSIGYMQQKVDTPKFTDEDVQQFAEKLKKLAMNSISEDTTSNPVIEVRTPEYEGPSIPNQDKTMPIEVKAQRIKWTPERCQEFMNDASTLPTKDVMEKWNILKKNRFYSMKNYVATLLEKMK